MWTDPTLRDALVSLAAAASGRVMLLARATRQSLTPSRVARTLLFELPFTAAVALLGWAVSEAISLGEPHRIVAIAVLARWGPERIEAALERALPQGLRNPPPPPKEPAA